MSKAIPQKQARRSARARRQSDEAPERFVQVHMPAWRRVLGAELGGLVLLGAALLFNFVLLAPELKIERFPANDLTFHLAASQRLADSFRRSEPFLDPWVSEWSLGFPVWRSYQPLPHLAAAAWLQVAAHFLAPATAFALLNYLLLALLPVSIYGGARLLGLSASASGLASILVLLPAAAADNLDGYGLSYSSEVWYGSGLYTQLFALHLLTWSLGLSARALDSGRRRLAASSNNVDSE